MGKVIIGGNSFKLNTENMVDNLYRDHHLGKSKGSTHKKHVPGIHLFFLEKTQKAFAFHFIEKKEMNRVLSVTAHRKGGRTGNGNKI
jgi:hypothetical protein